LAPAHPAVDAGGDEHDLSAGLAEQVDGVRVAEDAAEEDGQQQGVAQDADGPGPDLAAHAAERAEQSEDIAEHLAEQEELASAELDLGVEEPLQDIHVGPFTSDAVAPGEKGCLRGSGRRAPSRDLRDVRLSSRLYCRCRNSTGSTARCGSRTVTAGSDFHRPRSTSQ